MLKILPLQLGRIKQQLRNRRPLVITLLISLVTMTLLVGYAFVNRIQENDYISKDVDNNAIYSNVNPKFKIGWGSREDESKQLVRFKTVSSRSNPFSVSSPNIFKRILNWFVPIKGYEIEMSMSGARLADVSSYPEGSTKDILLSVADVIGSNDINTSTELLDSGREIGKIGGKDEVISKQTVVNRNVVNGVDLEYQVLKGEGLKEEIVINSLADYSKECSSEDCSVPLNEYIFDLKVDKGLVLKEGWYTLNGISSRTYYFEDSRGRYVAHFLPSFAVDSSGERTNDVKLDIQQQSDTEYEIKVRVNLGWLLSSDRVYPIRIDPSIVHATQTDFNSGIYNQSEYVTSSAGIGILGKQAPVIDANTVAYYKLDSLMDSSGKNNNISRLYNGINYGIKSTNLTYLFDRWAGVPNPGEIDIECPGGDAACYFIDMNDNRISTPNINNGIATIDTNTGDAFIMYSPSLTTQGITIYSGDSDNYIAVRYTGSTWQYDNNSAWVDFTPTANNILVAKITFFTSYTHLTVWPNRVEGYTHRGYYFDGVDDYLTVPDSSTLNPSAITIEAWIKPDKSQAGNFVSKAGNSGYRFRVLGSNIQFFDRGGTNNIVSINSIPFGEWTHVAATGDSSGLKLYINGVLDNSNTTAYGGPVTTDPLLLGRYLLVSTAELYSGYLDEVRISNVARSAEEIYANYQYGQRNHATYLSPVMKITGGSNIVLSSLTSGVRTGDGETPHSSNGLVAQWNFNETTGTTAVSGGSCGTTCNGTLTNFSNTSGQDVLPLSGWTYNNRRWGGGALMFDGVDDYVVTSASVGDFGTGDFTLETWMRSDSVQSISNYPTMISKDATNPARTGYNLVLHSTTGGDPAPYIVTWENSVGRTARGKRSIADGKWHHVVATRTSSALSLYIDGVLEAETLGTPLNTSNSVPFTMGKHSVSNWPYQGFLDSVRIYNRAITASEVASNYNQGYIGLLVRGGNTPTPDDGTWGNWSNLTGESSLISMDNSTLYSTNDTGLVSYWPMDEVSGSTVNDVKGVNHGTTTGTTVVDGAYGKGRRFNGTSDYVYVANSPSLNMSTTDFTISAWVKVDKLGQFGEIVGKGLNTDYELMVADNGKIRFLIVDGGVRAEFDSITALVPDRWYHIVAVKESSTTNGYIYINGNLDRVFSPFGDSLTDNTTADLYIGARRASDSSFQLFFPGIIDEVKIYNTVLTSAQIQTEYIKGLQDKGPFTQESSTLGEDNLEDGLVSYWKLDEEVGNDLYDAAGSNRAVAIGTTIVDGKVNKGRRFNGTNDYISIPNSPSLDMNGTGSKVSIEMQFNMDVLPSGFYNLIYKNSGIGAQYDCFQTNCSDRKFAIWIGSDGKMYFVSTSVNNIGVGQTEISSPAGSVVANTWYHVVAVIDSVAGAMKLYLNGVEIASGGYSTTGIRSAPGPMFLGVAYGGASLFKGVIDEVKIYNTAKSSDDILRMYNSSLVNRSQKIGNRLNTGLTNYWKLDESTNGTAIDSVGSANATSTGTTVVLGRYGNARNFDATDDKLELSPGLSTTGDYTVTAWFKYPLSSTSSSSWNTLLRSSVSDHHILVNKGSREIGIYDNANATGFHSSGYSLRRLSNGWHHLASVGSGTSTKFYIDGQYVGESDYKSTSTIDTIGNLHTGNQQWGIADDLKFFNVAKSEEEIREEYLSNSTFYANYPFPQTDLNTKSNLSFNFAGDRLGSYATAIVGGAPYANYQPDSRVVGHWRLEEQKYDRAPKYPGLVGYWDLQEASGTGAYMLDKSGYGNHVSYAGSPAYTAGIVGGARSFNGSTDYLGTPGDSILNINGSGSKLTVEFWFNAANLTAGWQPLIYKNDGNTDCSATGCSDRQYAFFIKNTGLLQFTSTSVDGVGVWTTSVATGDGAIVANTWYHVAGVIDSSAGTIKLYLNGNQVASGAYSTAGIRSAEGFLLFGVNQGGGIIFTGKLDEVGIYNTALTQAQIVERYQAGLNPHRDIKDSVGANHGISSTPSSSEGKIGRGMFFNGSSDRIAMANSSAVNIAGNITIEAWVKPIMPGGVIVHKDIQYSIGISDEGKVYWADSSNWSYASFGHKDIGIKFGEWQHIAVTKSGSLVKIYLNGVEKVSQTFGSAITTTDYTMHIGCYSTGNICYSGYFHGSIDEVRISSVARTPQAIREMYELGLRSHDIVVDFSATLSSSNLITGSTDHVFNIDGKSKGMLENASNLYVGEKLIVREVVGGVEYLVQGSVKSVNEITGAVEVYGWDSMSTFPAGGYSSKADVFKWQREYMQTSGRTIPTVLDSAKLLTFKFTNTYGGRNIWIDDVRVSDGYISSSPYTVSLPREYNYIQYKAIETTTDKLFTPYLNQVQVDYTTRTPKLNEIMRHGKWFITDEKQPFWWVGE